MQEIELVTLIWQLGYCINDGVQPNISTFFIRDLI